MMTRLFSTAFSFSLMTAALLSPPMATAQRVAAPVVEGQTTSELAATVSALRNSNAELTLELSELNAENSRLTGRIQELQFMLRQNQDELASLRSDDAAIAERLQSQGDAIADLEARMESMAVQVHANAGFAGVTALDEDASDIALDDSSGDGSGDPAPLVAPLATPIAPAPTETLAETSAPVSPEGTLGTLSASDLPGDAGTSFAEAKAKLQAFDYPGAEAAFRAFLAAFGDDPQAAEAQYWLAETLYQQQSHAESGAAYTDILEKYPDNARAPDALWKLARSLRLIGDGEQACALLEVLPQRYPNLSSVTNNYANRERALSSCAG